MNWRDHLISDPLILRGKPCIKGTRIPVALILGYLATGRDFSAIQREFRDGSCTDIFSGLNYVHHLKRGA